MNYNRSEILKFLEEKQALISVHEHLGCETLTYTDGDSSTYQQTISDFYDKLSESMVEEGNPESVVFAAAFFPMPLYRCYSFKEESIPPPNYSSGYDVYFNVNQLILDSCKDWFYENYETNANTFQLIPIPFLCIDPSIPATRFREIYDDVWDYIFGLKWHPFARDEDLNRYVESGYIELAAENHLPTVIHCARPGVPGDFDDILKNVVIPTQDLTPTINVAHSGFLHPSLTSEIFSQSLYFDLSPWSVVYQFRPDKFVGYSHSEVIQFLVDTLGSRLLFGFDSPWNILSYHTGDTYGASMKVDLHHVLNSLKLHSKEMHSQIFTENPLRYLNGMPSVY